MRSNGTRCGPLIDYGRCVVGVRYNDVGGSKEQINKLREVVETPLLHPERFVSLGIDPPKGVLLYGPPGTGKTVRLPAISSPVLFLPLPVRLRSTSAQLPPLHRLRVRPFRRCTPPCSCAPVLWRTGRTRASSA